MSKLAQTLLESAVINSNFDLRNSVYSVTFGNGQGEFSYDPTAILNSDTQNDVVQIYVNVNVLQNTTNYSDCYYALQQLLDTFPNLAHVYINVCWYVTDLNCGATNVKPGVMTTTLNTEPYQWNVSNVDRTNAHLISQINGIPAFQGTPADVSLLNLVLALNSRDIAFSVCLGLIPDIPTGNSLANPYSNNGATAGEPAYPQIQLLTCSPSIGSTGQASGTATVDTQISSFFGNALATDWSVYYGVDEILTTVYGGQPRELYTYSSFALYYATLFSTFVSEFSNTKMNNFIIGKHLSGLTNQQNANGEFPAITNLVSIAQKCATIFKGQNIGISYLADWNEWSGIVPNSTYPVYSYPSAWTFNMDTLWASPYIDFIAISPNADVTDWRSFGPNLDARFYNSIDNVFYQTSGIVGGPYYDYYYSSDYDRLNQNRSSISGVNGSSDAWVYQIKNYSDWLDNEHYNVILNNIGSVVYDTTKTSWIPNSKPVSFIDARCPTINLGTNQPSAYLNENSTDLENPYFSNLTADNSLPQTYYSALLQTLSNFSYTQEIAISYWDQRPYPWYPKLNTQFADSVNYAKSTVINNKFYLVDPTQSYAQYIDYTKLLTDFLSTNNFWVTFFEAAGQQWNLLFHGALNELANIRNVDSISDELKAANVRMMGYRIPDYGLTYNQYDNLMRYLGSYGLTHGSSVQFANFIAYISNIKFQYLPLYIDGLNIGTLSNSPGTLITDGGSWLPTPYYDIEYNNDQANLVSESLFLTLFKNAAPAHLVLRNLTGVTIIPSFSLYVSAVMTSTSMTISSPATATL